MYLKLCRGDANGAANRHNILRSAGVDNFRARLYMNVDFELLDKYTLIARLGTSIARYVLHCMSFMGFHLYSGLMY